MDTINTYNDTGPLFQNSFSTPKYINPDYLFSHLVEVASYTVNNIFTKEALTDLYSVASVFSIFFIAVIIYCIIRMFEIRKKEHLHLHHEIEEYARKHAEKENNTESVIKDNPEKTG